MKKSTLTLLLMLTITLLMSACSNQPEENIPYQQSKLPQQQISDSEHQVTEDFSDDYPTEEDMPDQQPEFLQQHISPLGRQVTEDFLSEFPSIFQSHRGWRNIETGAMYALNRENWQLESVEDINPLDMPAVFIGATGDYLAADGQIYYDRNGNLITTAPFILYSEGRGLALADFFSLYDLTGNGIPEIVVNFIDWSDPGFGISGPTVLYKFIDGAFQKLATIERAAYFFLDPDQQIILLYEDTYYDISGYYYLRFTDYGIDLEEIILPGQSLVDGPNWFDHHHGSGFWHNPTPLMYGTGIQLTRIPPLTDLQEEIAESLRNRD